MVNHLGRLFVTSDAATIIREIEVVHPAAKLLVMASQAQEAEMGDATNTVLILAGELLKKAENLLVMGLHPSEIVRGYELACGKALAELESAYTGCGRASEGGMLTLLRRPLDAQARYAAYAIGPRGRTQACDRVKTVWLRGHTRGAGGGGCPRRHAA